MEWVLVVSMLFINGVEGQAEFQFRTEGDCRHVKEMAENYVDRYNMFGLEDFNVTCETMVSIPKGEVPNVDLY